MIFVFEELYKAKIINFFERMQLMKKMFLLALPFLLISCAHEVEVESSADYKCGDQVLETQYLDDDSMIVKLDGRNHMLESVISASGDKYSNSQGNIIFWNKGSDSYFELNGKSYPQCARIVK